MKVGDFVYSKATAFDHDGIVLLISDENTCYSQKQISYPEARREYILKADRGDEPASLRSSIVNKNQYEEFSLERFAEVLERQPLIRPSERANFSKFLIQKLIEAFGNPPTSPVEPIKRPMVVEGVMEGFIRVNNK